MESKNRLISLTIKELEFVGLSLPLFNLFNIVVKRHEIEINYNEYKKILEESMRFKILKEDGYTNVNLIKTGEI